MPFFFLWNRFRLVFRTRWLNDNAYMQKECCRTASPWRMSCILNGFFTVAFVIARSTSSSCITLTKMASGGGNFLFEKSVCTRILRSTATVQNVPCAACAAVGRQSTWPRQRGRWQAMRVAGRRQLSEVITSAPLAATCGSEKVTKLGPDTLQLPSRATQGPLKSYTRLHRTLERGI